jgi:2-keto-4-pentenoate hydratase/2-oxohepta-3-ene-1,7-dioic acid hydratase in catechol pathway
VTVKAALAPALCMEFPLPCGVNRPGGSSNFVAACPNSVAPLDELPAGARGLRIQTRLNGHTVQNAVTTDMIFDVATMISISSEPFALALGAIIISGTPAGIGFQGIRSCS